jgi:hypothetical protein
MLPSSHDWEPPAIPGRFIDPERELRMSAVTRDQLLAWVEEGERASDAGQGRTRLAIYRSAVVEDDAVPEGWIRMLLYARV